jgi:hypothetical protein
VSPECKRSSAAKQPSPLILPGDDAKASAMRTVVWNNSVGFGGDPVAETSSTAKSVKREAGDILNLPRETAN